MSNILNKKEFMGIFIDNTWSDGSGEKIITSLNPATSETLWQGQSASHEDVDKAYRAAQKAYPAWAKLTFDERIIYLERYKKSLLQNQTLLTECIAKETGKPLWESKSETEAMIKKIDISIAAYLARTGIRQETLVSGVHSFTRHKPHGVALVLGPFNFPGHLPNGHIVPALLAGNTVVFKPSNLTPLVSILMFKCFEEAGFPAGVVNLVQGEGLIGEYLSKHNALDALMFTGSYRVGLLLSKWFSEKPNKILALEMGGNNPLVVNRITNIEAAVYITLQSAYLTAGQRCSCARRLIIVKNKENENYFQALTKAIEKINVGAYDKKPEPFMGPVISLEAKNNILKAYQTLLHNGAEVVVPMNSLSDKGYFLSPGLVVSKIKSETSTTSENEIFGFDDKIFKFDNEIFGPLLQCYFVDTFDEAINLANHTQYGLTAGLLSDSKEDYEHFYTMIKAGVINWNQPLTGASSHAPFGGIKNSGNHRPSAFYAADYCAYPVASLETETLQMPLQISPGLNI